MAINLTLTADESLSSQVYALYSTLNEMLWSLTIFRKREKDYVPR